MKLNSLIFCQDVRKEIHGTLSIIGQFNALRGFLGEKYTFKVFFSVTDFIGMAQLFVTVKSPEGVELKRFLTDEIGCTTREDHYTGFFSINDLLLRSYGRYTISVSHGGKELGAIKLNYIVKDFRTNIIMYHGKPIEVPRTNIHDNRELLHYSKLMLRKFSRLDRPYESVEFISQFMESDGIGSVSSHLVNQMIEDGIKVKPRAVYIDEQSKEYIRKIPEDVKTNKDCDITIVNTLPVHLKDAHNAKRLLLFTYWEASKINKGWANVADMADAIFVPSRYVKNVYENSGVKAPIKIYQQPISPMFQYQRWEKGTGEEDYFDILFLGTCIPRKGIDIFLTAMDKVFGNDPKVRIRIHTKPWSRALGDTSTEVVKSYGDNPKYFITRSVMPTKKIVEMIQQADLVVAPSRSEGLGLIPIQSVMCGTPSIVPKHSGFEEYSHHPGFVTVDTNTLTKAEGIYEEGEWYEPCFDEVCDKLVYARNNHKTLLEAAERGGKILRETYSVSSTYKKVKSLINKIYS
jgi:glycosyltransferase involved in cell wall biosynthesis